MPGYDEIKDKLKSEFDLWIANRNDNHYKYYSTGYGARLPTDQKKLHDATLAYGGLYTERHSLT